MQWITTANTRWAATLWVKSNCGPAKPNKLTLACFSALSRGHISTEAQETPFILTRSNWPSRYDRFLIKDPLIILWDNNENAKQTKETILSCSVAEKLLGSVHLSRYTSKGKGVYSGPRPVHQPSFLIIRQVGVFFVILLTNQLTYRHIDDTQSEVMTACGDPAPVLRLLLCLNVSEAASGKNFTPALIRLWR